MSVQSIDGESETFGPLVLIDTAGCEMEETADQDSNSRMNEGEAKVSPAYEDRCTVSTRNAVTKLAVQIGGGYSLLFACDGADYNGVWS